MYIVQGSPVHMWLKLCPLIVATSGLTLSGYNNRWLLYLAVPYVTLLLHYTLAAMGLYLSGDYNRLVLL